MKVRLVYLVGFEGADPEQTKETNACIDSLKRKYEARATAVAIARIKTGTSNAAFMALQKGKKLTKQPGQDQFAVLRGNDPGDYAASGGGQRGIGAYFIFHGRAESADVNVPAVVTMCRWLMDKHPGGQFRKVMLMVCGYAGVDRGTRSNLDKLATNLAASPGVAAADLPRLAGWTNFITVGAGGGKLAASPQARNEIRPAKDLVNTCKYVYVYENGGYAKKLLSGPHDPAWHDPEVASIGELTVPLPEGLSPI